MLCWYNPQNEGQLKSWTSDFEKSEIIVNTFVNDLYDDSGIDSFNSFFATHNKIRSLQARSHSLTT